MTAAAERAALAAALGRTTAAVRATTSAVRDLNAVIDEALLAAQPDPDVQAAYRRILASKAPKG